MGETLPSMVLELFRDFPDKLNSRASCPLRIYAAKTLNGIMIVCWGSAKNIFMAQDCSEFSSEGFRDFSLCVPGLCLRKQHAKQERPQGFGISGSRFGIRGIGEAEACKATERVVACCLLPLVLCEEGPTSSSWQGWTSPTRPGLLVITNGSYPTGLKLGTGTG